MRERDNKQHTTIKEEDNYILIQITLFDVNKKYKPISTLVKVPNLEYYKEHSKEVKEKGYQQICNQRYLTGKELLNLGYKKVKIRNYTLWKELQKRKGEKDNEEK